MSTDMPVSHPAVSHPELPPQSPPMPATGPPPPGQVTPVDKPIRRMRRRLKMPPPQVIVAVALAGTALELLLWQVAGPTWGVIVHAALAAMLLLAAAVAVMWRRRTRSRARSGRSAGLLSRAAGARTPMGRLFGRSGSGGGSASNRRASLLGGPRSTGGTGRRSLFDGRTATGTSAGGVRRGGLLGRLGKSGSATPGVSASRKTGSPGRVRGALSRIGSSRAGDLLRGKDGRLSGGVRKQTSTESGPGRGNGRRTGTGKVLTDFLHGFRGGAKKASQTATKIEQRRKPSPYPRDKDGNPIKPTPKTSEPAAQQKDQPKHASTSKAQDKPTNNVVDMVKQEIETVAVTAPVVTTGGAHMGDMNKVRAAADELAAALKDYDPEDMHQLVREMPYFGEALNAVQAGIRQMASRAESEWPVAAPVAEAIRSIADDVKAGAGTAESAHGTIRSENETDIERGEAPRHGSMRVESKWNVNGNG